MTIVINVHREGYGRDQIESTMTVGEMIEALSEFDPDTPIMVGNDPMRYGWYTYGSISFEDICEVEDEEEDMEDEEE